jgi:hypothetical protein
LYPGCSDIAQSGKVIAFFQCAEDPLEDIALFADKQFSVLLMLCKGFVAIGAVHAVLKVALFEHVAVRLAGVALVRIDTRLPGKDSVFHKPPL